MRNSQSIKVGDLSAHLENKGLSPEAFAAAAGLSHMTIRRWLKKPDVTPIQAKYHMILRPLLGCASSSDGAAILATDAMQSFYSLDVTLMMNEIEKSGRNFQSLKTLDKDLNEKLDGGRFDKVFVESCKRLYSAARSSSASAPATAVAVGALLYFISPIDLIPDHIPVIGYLDDLAILSTAINRVFGSRPYRRN